MFQLLKIEDQLERFNGVRKKNIFDIGPIGNIGDPRLNSPYIDRGISEISKKISNIDVKVENKNNNPLLGKGKDDEMESLKKKLYDEIRNIMK